MWDLLRVALRNVGRNKRRSLITAITVFIGVLVIAGTRGLLNGLQGEIRSALTQKMHGDLQLHKAGYQDSIDASPYKVMFPLDAALQQKLRDTPGVVAWSPRLRVLGLLNHQKSQTTVPVMIQAFDSVAETAVCPRLPASIVQGGMLVSGTERMEQVQRDDDLAEAQFFDPAQKARPKSIRNTSGQHQILVTPGLFRGFEAAIGDEWCCCCRTRTTCNRQWWHRSPGARLRPAECPEPFDLDGRGHTGQDAEPGRRNFRAGHFHR